MDGHGRFLILFLAAVVDLHGLERLDRLKIELYDIDPDVQNWHLQSFGKCNAVKCMGKDILTEFSHNTLLYLNFCALGRSGKKLESFFESLKKDGKYCMFSGTTIRGAKRRMNALKGQLTKLGIPYDNVETERKDFGTFVVNSPQIYVSKNALHRSASCASKTQPATSVSEHLAPDMPFCRRCHKH